MLAPRPRFWSRNLCPSWNAPELVVQFWDFTQAPGCQKGVHPASVTSTGVSAWPLSPAHPTALHTPQTCTPHSPLLLLLRYYGDRKTFCGWVWVLLPSQNTDSFPSWDLVTIPHPKTQQCFREAGFKYRFVLPSYKPLFSTFRCQCFPGLEWDFLTLFFRVMGLCCIILAPHPIQTAQRWASGNPSTSLTRQQVRHVLTWGRERRK